MKLKLKVYSDGASRGNPGPSAIAFMILTEDGKILKRHSRYVGIRTNNQAEYEALISALEFASKLTSQEVVCYLDSELVVKHLNGEYQVKNPNLKNLWLKVKELEQKFQKTSFMYVPRTDRYIEKVDLLANQTLDKVTNRCL
ncbi:MAG: ribonuclease HI family protein [Candidatus Bathyarchaeota archaeon]|nr:ribonuclease HI family protein [Candidatus Bathyarchaeota archaeon]